jgi:membrane protease YdiL (CAAX protease family)
MKNNERIIYGLIITIGIFAIATLLGSKLEMNIDFFPKSFGTHSVMLILSVLVIYVMRVNVNYKISLPQLRTIAKPIIFGVLTTIVVNILMTIVTVIFKGDVESHPAMTEMNTMQIFLFIFIYASIAEELLFRGFLQNILQPLSNSGITVFRRKLTLPVMISALAFGLGHLILISTGAGVLFLLRIVVFTTILGLFAGYYQEKYNNNAYAIIVHMAGNLVGVIGVFFMNNVA